MPGNPVPGLPFMRTMQRFEFFALACEVIGDIFKAGVWTGVLLVTLVIGIIVWLFTRSKA
jgi:hypothetical protein